MTDKVALIVAAGPGVGTSLARRLGRDGYAVSLVARNRSRLDELGAALQAEGITTGWTACDVTDADELAAAVTRFGGFTGRLDVVHFNAVAFRMATATALSAAALLTDLAVGVASLTTVVGAALPFLRPGGCVLATGGGAADAPMAAAASLGVQKAALRNLVDALDGDLRERGVRAASMTVRGVIAAGTPFDPDRIADALAGLATAAATAGDEWRTEVRFDGR